MIKHFIFITLVSLSVHSCLSGAAHATSKTEIRELAAENNWSIKDVVRMCREVEQASDDVLESEAIQRLEEVFESAEETCELLK